MNEANILGTGAVVGMVGIVATTVLALLVTAKRLRRAASLARSPVSNARVLGESNALEIPLIAAFKGVKGVPWWALCWSSINPKLVLHEREIEIGLVGSKRMPYAAIESIDVRTAPATVNIVVNFVGKRISFTGNTVNSPTAAHALRHLQAKGCQLTDRAEKLLTDVGQ